MRKSKNKIVLEYIENTIKNDPFLSNIVYKWMLKGGPSLFDVKTVEDEFSAKGIISPKEPREKTEPWDESGKYDIPAQTYKDIVLSVCRREKAKTKSDTAFEKKLKWLKSVVHLNSREFSIVRFYAYLKRSNILNVFVNEIFVHSRGGRNSFSIYDFPEVVDMNEKEIQKTLAPSGRLCHSGLLWRESRGEMCLSSLVYDYLNIPLKSKEELKQLMVGSCVLGEIPLSAYPYLENTPEYLRKLLKNALKTKGKGVHILLYGAPGTGKTEFAKSLALSLGKNLYSVCDGHGEKSEPNRMDRLYSLKLADFILGNSQDLLLLDEAEDVFRSPIFGVEPGSKSFMNGLLEENAHPVLWTSNNIRCIDPAFLRRFTYVVEFKKPNITVRRQIWEKALQKNHFTLSQNEISFLSQNYDVPPSMIQSVIRSTSLAEGNYADIKNTLSGFEKALGEKYQKSCNDNGNFNTELLNTDTDMEKLANRLCTCNGRNFSLCLYGAPGTGKSAFARYIAEKLNLDVVEKKASDLLGRYVGESERNIAAAFDEAQQRKALLIFDEADSLLRDRKSAYHSWEISQVNEMLTWMERHPYPFVCTTNLMDNLDKASLRRFTFKIKYDYLTPDQVGKAFEYFFGQKLLHEEAYRFNSLVPADFLVVKKKAEILGYLENQNELIAMLEKEVEAKNGHSRSHKIGFI